MSGSRFGRSAATGAAGRCIFEAAPDFRAKPGILAGGVAAGQRIAGQEQARRGLDETARALGRAHAVPDGQPGGIGHPSGIWAAGPAAITMIPAASTVMAAASAAHALRSAAGRMARVEAPGIPPRAPEPAAAAGVFRRSERLGLEPVPLRSPADESRFPARGAGSDAFREVTPCASQRATANSKFGDSSIDQS